MGDIVDEIEVKPNRYKLILKWVIAVSGSLIATAFLVGQLKTKYVNRLDRIESNQLEMKVENRKGFTDVNARIDKIYGDGLFMFNEFQKNNNQQLNLIIDYGDDNKEMLKRMLEINRLNLESEVKKARTENPTPLLQDPKISPTPTQNDYMSEVYFIETETNDTVFNLGGATKKYINNIDKKRYEIGAITDNETYPGRYDVSYRKKR